MWCCWSPLSLLSSLLLHSSPPPSFHAFFPRGLPYNSAAPAVSSMFRKLPLLLLAAVAVMMRPSEGFLTPPPSSSSSARTMRLYEKINQQIDLESPKVRDYTWPLGLCVASIYDTQLPPCETVPRQTPYVAPLPCPRHVRPQ